ncbi:sensor histidine kinase [Allonocardiopsis opalescens]|uniref:histidine kinase n=1 Tax=Allonocardiopsis opalescens TaxID=1144618 RepID=A0A2T0QAX9_9ACTN|nr:histidine kinase [Allonocardiopsis opalescens]PRY00962.1 signal transduction histidine kinase [Allonocardiopsis opalescens]
MVAVAVAKTPGRTGPAARLRDQLVAVVHVMTGLALFPLYLVPVLLFVIGLALVPVFLVGVPVLLLGCLGALAVGWVQTHRISAVLSVELPPVRPWWAVRSGERLTLWQRVGFNGVALRAVGYAAAACFWGLLAAAVLYVLLAVSVTLLASPVWLLLLDLDRPGLDLGAPRAVLIAAGLLTGGAVLVFTGWIATQLTTVDVVLVRRLLLDGQVKHLRQRVRRLSASRQRMVDAAEAERRRIERDLHDGTQQRLLALTMTLTRARSWMNRDLDHARQLLEEAHNEAKEAMTELHDITHGLHPTILTDHGLESALPVLAGRCPVPVNLVIELKSRPSARTEGVAYYVASEVLTNVAKHAEAGRVDLRVERQGELLWMVVADDGRGGASPERGTGLRGLADRVQAVDGSITVDSPEGGPTVVSVELPWEA